MRIAAAKADALLLCKWLNGSAPCLSPLQEVPGQTHSFVEHIQLGVREAAADPEALLLFSGGKTRRHVVAGMRGRGQAALWSVSSHQPAHVCPAGPASLPPRSGQLIHCCHCRDAGPRAEGEGYWLVAEAAKWFGHEEVRERAFTEVGAGAVLQRHVLHSVWLAWACGPEGQPAGAAHPPLCSMQLSHAFYTPQDRARDSFENLLFGLCRFFELTGRFPEFIVVVRVGGKL